MTAPGGGSGTSLRDWVDAVRATGVQAALPGAQPRPVRSRYAADNQRSGVQPWAAGADGISLRDWAEVADLLGRLPQGGFEVWVRHADGRPRVIRNDPLLDDGTPMPTRYWLVSASDRVAVSRLESRGGVRQAEAAVDAAELAAAHARYAAERDAALPVAHDGPRPGGGVGGTRRGVKCLHAHYAWHLAGGADPVGTWVAAELAAVDVPAEPDADVPAEPDAEAPAEPDATATDAGVTTDTATDDTAAAGQAPPGS